MADANVKEWQIEGSAAVPPEHSRSTTFIWRVSILVFAPLAAFATLLAGLAWDWSLWRMIGVAMVGAGVAGATLEALDPPRGLEAVIGIGIVTAIATAIWWAIAVFAFIGLFLLLGVG